MHTPAPPTERPPLTPLVDIAFLMLIFFMSLPFKRLDHKLEAFLPRDVGWIWSDQQPRDVVRIEVRSGAKGTIFRLGQNTAPTAEGLEPVLRKLGPEYRYEVESGPAVAWMEVVSVVDLLKRLDHTHFAFHGTKTPPAEIRRMFQLPRPTPR